MAWEELQVIRHFEAGLPKITIGLPEKAASCVND
jgi:hypothetical protein